MQTNDTSDVPIRRSEDYSTRSLFSMFAWMNMQISIDSRVHKVLGGGDADGSFIAQSDLQKLNTLAHFNRQFYARLLKLIL